MLSFCFVMNVPLSKSIVMIWFISEYIDYRFVTFTRLDSLRTPQRQRRGRGGRRGALQKDAFHP